MRLSARRREWGRISLAARITCSWIAALLLMPLARAEALKDLPASAFAAQIVAAQQLAQACAGDAVACDAATLPGREHITGAPAGAFYVDWEWMRDDLEAAKTAAAADRVKQMQRVEAHLAALGAEAGVPPPAGAAAEFGRARNAANKALAREEFRVAGGPGWMERQWARTQDWIMRLFTGMDRLGKRAPWLAPAIEWGCFGLAAAGLLWFVRQSLARQALRISLGEGAALAGASDRDPEDWARLAQEHAAAEDWREAMHCLYWAAIALMETRRAWKPNPTRTPREYPRLLRPGSEAQRALGELTRGFERVWYGHAPVDRVQYEAAHHSFRALETARPERSGEAPEATAPTSLPVMGGA